jgi:hypothetical protein
MKQPNNEVHTENSYQDEHFPKLEIIQSMKNISILEANQFQSDSQRSDCHLHLEQNTEIKASLST